MLPRILRVLTRRRVLTTVAVVVLLALVGSLALLAPEGNRPPAQGELTDAVPQNPTSQPLGTTQFGIASFNVLGAGHTDGPKPPRKGWANSAQRLDWTRTLLKNQSVGVVGLQEMHPPQVKRFATYAEWGMFPDRVLANNGSDNVVAWRVDTFEAIAKKTIKIPYFNGRDVKMPYVQLQHHASGQRFWVLSVHPPANIGGNHQKWRDLAVQRMGALVKDLKARYPGQPVYTTGDMNDRTKFFCPFVTLTGSASANGGSVQGNVCTPPPAMEVDWVLGTVPNTFTNYRSFRTPFVKMTSDHPFVVAQANIPTPDVSRTGAQRVVVVSVEGLRGATAASMSARGSAPALAAMTRQGSSTFNARSAPESSRVLPNVLSTISGRHVKRSTGGHGVASDSLTGTVHGTAGTYVSTMFDMAHNNGLSTGIYSSSAVTAPLRSSWSATNGGPDPYGVDNGRAKISRYSANATDPKTVRAYLSAPRQRLTLIHLTGPRTAGRQYGFNSARYRTAVTQFDRQLARVRRSLSRDTVLVVTSTSGGTGRSNALRRSRSTYRVPLLVTGPGVRPGGDLYRMNPAWTAPGGRHLGWGQRPLTSAVVANLSLALLRLPSLPGSTANTAQNFQVLKQ